MEFKCSKCKKVLSSNQRLKMHEEKCNGLSKLQCELCHKKFKTKATKYKHKKNIVCLRNNTITNDINVNDIQTKIEDYKKDKEKKEINNETEDTIYLLQEREFKRLKEPVYKIGKTKRLKSRLKKYPKNSDIILFIKVNNCDKIEEILLKIFNKTYIQRNEYGKEYFEGNLNSMIQLIIKIIDREINHQEQ